MHRAATCTASAGAGAVAADHLDHRLGEAGRPAVEVVGAAGDHAQLGRAAAARGARSRSSASVPWTMRGTGTWRRCGRRQPGHAGDAGAGAAQRGDRDWFIGPPRGVSVSRSSVPGRIRSGSGPSRARLRGVERAPGAVDLRGVGAGGQLARPRSPRACRRGGRSPSGACGRPRGRGTTTRGRGRAAAARRASAGRVVPGGRRRPGPARGERAGDRQPAQARPAARRSAGGQPAARLRSRPATAAPAASSAVTTSSQASATWSTSAASPVDQRASSGSGWRARRGRRRTSRQQPRLATASTSEEAGGAEVVPERSCSNLAFASVCLF